MLAAAIKRAHPETTVKLSHRLFFSYRDPARVVHHPSPRNGDNERPAKGAKDPRERNEREGMVYFEILMPSGLSAPLYRDRGRVYLRVNISDRKSDTNLRQL